MIHAGWVVIIRNPSFLFSIWRNWSFWRLPQKKEKNLHGSTTMNSLSIHTLVNVYTSALLACLAMWNSMSLDGIRYSSNHGFYIRVVLPYWQTQNQNAPVKIQTSHFWLEQSLALYQQSWYDLLSYLKFCFNPICWKEQL